MDVLLPVLTLVLTVVVAVLLILLLSHRQRDERLDRRDAERQEQLVNQVADEVLNEIDSRQSDSERSLQQIGTALTGSLAGIGQSQAALLEGISRQTQRTAQGQDERFDRMQAALNDSLSRIEARMAGLQADNARQLTEMRQTVDEKLTASLDRRLSESFSQVSTRLEQVYQGLGEMRTLAAGVGDLKKVLTNVKTRGIWGEMQLGVLLSQVLSPGQYEENVAVVPGSAERVEYAIRLPGSGPAPVWLPVDSKFPQEDWLRLQQAVDGGSPAEAEEARKALFTRFRTEARRISTKYVQPPCSTDFAIMFLPTEGLYAEAVRDGILLESLQREFRVVVAGPSTFSALLNALQMGFRTLAIQQRSGEVWQLLSAVRNDFGRFSEVLEKTQQRLRQASESIDTAVSRTHSIRRRLDAVEENLPGALLQPGEDAPEE